MSIAPSAVVAQAQILDPTMGPPAWWSGMFALVVVVGIGIGVNRLSTARRLADKAGMDNRTLQS